jgi:ribonuclease P protein component
MGEVVTIYEVPKAESEKTRFAFLCDRNIKKATERNRLKRILREIVRTNRVYIQNHNTIFLVKGSARDKTYWQIKEDFVSVISGTPQ